MTVKTLAVSSPEGTTGDLILTLAEREPNDFQKVVAVTIDSSFSRRGVDVIKVDKNKNTDSAAKQLKADCFILIPPASEDKVDIAKKYLEVAKKASINHLILVSGFRGMEEPNTPAMNCFRQIEQMAMESGIPCVVIARLAFRSENILAYVKQIKEGKLPIPLQHGRFAPAALSDACVAILSLARTCAHLSPEHVTSVVRNLTGSELVGGQEMADAVSKVLNKKIKFEVIEDEQASQILTTAGLPSSEKDFIIETYHLAREGKLETVSGDLELLLGNKPMGLVDFFKLHKKTLEGK